MIGTKCRLSQFVERERLRVCRHRGFDPHGLENSGRRHIGSATAQPKINLLSSQIIDRLDIRTGEHLKLLVIELCDVLQVFFYARKRWIPSDVVEHVRLHDGEIDATNEDDIFGVLQRAGARDRQKPQVVPIARKSEPQIYRVIRPFGDDPEEAVICFVAHRVAQSGRRVGREVCLVFGG